MNIQTLALILLWIIIGLFLIALLFGAFWWTYHRGQSSTEESINKALIFKVNGKHLEKPKKAELIQQTDKVFQYRYGKNDDDIVFVSKKLETIFYKGCKLIFNKSGKIFGVNFDNVNNEGISESEKETLLKEFIKANIGTGAVKAIQKSQSIVFNIILILVALAIGAGAVLGFQSFAKQMENRQTQQTPVQQQIIPAK